MGTPTDRDHRFDRALRALRRGELGAALGQLASLAADFPHDEEVAQKLAALRESALPAELAVAPADAALSPLEDAECRATAGDLPGAIAIYARLARGTPANLLLSDRLHELEAAAGFVDKTGSPRPVSRQTDALTTLLDRISARRRR